MGTIRVRVAYKRLIYLTNSNLSNRTFTLLLLTLAQQKAPQQGCFFDAAPRKELAFILRIKMPLTGIDLHFCRWQKLW